MVATPDGMRPIESLEVGDSVLSRNDKTGEVGFKKIEHVHRYHTNRVCRLLITRAHRTPTRQRGRSEPHRVGKGSASADDDSSESGSSGDAEDSESATELPIQELLCTTGHNFYSVTRSDWIAAVYLRPGEVLLDASGRIQRVVGVTCEDAHAPVRDFEVADWHTYFVSQPGAATPVWTHNGGKDKPCNSNPDSPSGSRPEFRTPEQNRRERNRYKNRKDEARRRWEDRTGNDWPTDEHGNPWPGEHTPPLKEWGDALDDVTPRNPGLPDPHNIPGSDGKTDYQRWGSLGTPARKKKKGG